MSGVFKLWVVGEEKPACYLLINGQVVGGKQLPNLPGLDLKKGAGGGPGFHWVFDEKPSPRRF